MDSLLPPNHPLPYVLVGAISFGVSCLLISNLDSVSRQVLQYGLQICITIISQSMIASVDIQLFDILNHSLSHIDSFFKPGGKSRHWTEQAGAVVKILVITHFLSIWRRVVCLLRGGAASVASRLPSLAGS